jgi:hypothetical protein
LDAVPTFGHRCHDQASVQGFPIDRSGRSAQRLGEAHGMMDDRLRQPRLAFVHQPVKPVDLRLQSIGERDHGLLQPRLDFGLGGRPSVTVACLPAGGRSASTLFSTFLPFGAVCSLARRGGARGCHGITIRGRLLRPGQNGFKPDHRP